MTWSYLCNIIHLCLEIGGYKYWYLLILHGSSFFIYLLSVFVIFVLRMFPLRYHAYVTFNNTSLRL